jgi:hypothetical protein
VESDPSNDVTGIRTSNAINIIRTITPNGKQNDFATNQSYNQVSPSINNLSLVVPRAGTASSPQPGPKNTQTAIA